VHALAQSWKLKLGLCGQNRLLRPQFMQHMICAGKVHLYTFHLVSVRSVVDRFV
jgi:hypothetical protein